MIDTKQLRKLAEKALSVDEAWFDEYELEALQLGQPDTKYIAACSPDNLLQLLDRLDELERIAGVLQNNLELIKNTKDGDFAQIYAESTLELLKSSKSK
jgi:hypothetical protein